MQNKIIELKIKVNIKKNNLRRFLHQNIVSKIRYTMFNIIVLIPKSTCRDISSCTFSYTKEIKLKILYFVSYNY